MNTDNDPIESLAQHLHWALEKFDPSDPPDGVIENDVDWRTWDYLDDHQREIYRATAQSLLTRRGLLLAALRRHKPRHQ